MASQKEFRHAPSAEDSVSADCLVDAPLPTAPIIRHLHDATTTQTAPPTDNSNDTNQAFTQMESREMAHETAPIPVPSGHARSSRKVNQSKHGSGLSDTTPMMAAADSPDSSDLEKVTESIVVLEDPGANTMRPPPTPIDTAAAPSALERQSSTAASSLTSRATNRLSLTLPIAQPNSDASRPTPITIASTPSSVPPTPLDSSAVPLPSNVNEFIIAIAAKERKVLELKEELAREEAEIAYLKRQLSSTDALSNRGPAQYFESASNAATPASDGDLLSPRRSADLERRFHFSQNQGTPTQTKRRVLCGGHTRTLSLLSPARTKSEFSLSGDQSAQDQCRSPAADRRAGHPASARLPQRASWQPRSHQNSPVVPQLVEDLKVGFRAFVEDIRQITIGDEPINGMNPQRNGNGSHRRAGSLSQGASTDLEPRIRPSQTQQKGRLTEASAERPKLARTKHFSWTPLGFESLDDTDWTSWQGAQSPVPARSTRWSGSTINSGIADDIQIIPESADESTTPGYVSSSACQIEECEEGVALTASIVEKREPGTHPYCLHCRRNSKSSSQMWSID